MQNTPDPTASQQAVDPSRALWPTLTYRDAPTAIRFLVDALGFREVAVYPGGAPGTVAHAELRWPAGGGIMLSTAGTDVVRLPAGTGSVYLVTADTDALFERAVGRGAVVVREPADQDYGSRDAVVRDPEGVHWSFGGYTGADEGPHQEPAELERAAWRALSTSGAAATTFYAEVLDDAVTMLLPGAMVLRDREEILTSMAGEPWSEHHLEQLRTAHPTPGTAVVSYGVVARRGTVEYSALMSSTYVRRPAGWRLVHHQQTPR